MNVIRTYRAITFRQWLILLGFWSLMATIITNQLYFTSIKNGLSPVWIDLLVEQLPIWYLWMLCTPVFIFIVNRYPFNTDQWLKPVLVYLITGIFMLLILSNATLIYMFLLHG